MNYYTIPYDILESLGGNHLIVSVESEVCSWGVDNSPELKITNCKNCGATVHGHKCEYCGTEY
jgi:hypothetical protein